MSDRELPDPSEYEWSFELRDGVGVWYLEGWRGFPDESLEAVSEHYRERASRGDVTATVAVFGDKTSLPAETQEYMAEEWSANGEYVDVDRIGFVSEGITAMAVRSNVEVSAATEEFGDVDAAVEWARG
jgi:hypothetical protein